MSKHRSSLDSKTELDFHYLLGLMPPLHNVPEFSWLPELFSIIGYERLILLCKYAGGESITIPTLEELTTSIEALDWFYSIDIKHDKEITDVPEDLMSHVCKIMEIYHARNN